MLFHNGRAVVLPMKCMYFQDAWNILEESKIKFKGQYNGSLLCTGCVDHSASE